ncbi:MAG: hypothetical protein ACREJD_17130 [Phycisphaerales bacterium]
MNSHEHEIDAALLETDAVARRAARLDASSARELPGRASGVTLEDRIFIATKDVLNSSSPVVARIGRGSQQNYAKVWKLAAAVAIVAGLSAAMITLRPATTVPTIASADGHRAAADVELVLAAVSLLDEPLSGNFDQLAEDAARLHELVTTDRTFPTETTEEKTTKQGV